MNKIKEVSNEILKHAKNTGLRLGQNNRCELLTNISGTGGQNT